jgi:subtilisin family serine protease
VVQSGGFGDNIPGGPATGPWNITLGAGSRIAVLDSGVDSNHPDIAPNLVLNLSEVNQEALPSPCDDGSPQDQQGHGTWTASLATGALGPTTGQVIGVAPHAALLNIKVLQRMPGYGAGTLTQCENGQAGGLLSWVLQGIEDAVANHADVVSLSLGTLVDTSTGDGAGWLAQFDSVTFAAAQAGVTIVAALGNDGLNLSSGTLVELPAQSRSVLPVVAATNPACAENVATGAVCTAGPITRPYYSNYGATLNAIAAPGGSYPEGPNNGVSGFVYGACSSGLTNTLDGLPANGNSFGCFGLGHTAYVQAMGTSASSPLVAGAAALLHAAHPGWTPAQIVAALRSSASSNPAMAEPELNLATALTLN